MKIKEKGNTIVVKRIDENLERFIQKIVDQQNTFLSHNIIIDLGTYSLKEREVSLFETLNNLFKSHKKSFVLVVAEADFNEFTETITVVPTLQEAYDIIEMEEIERDLGF